MCGNPISRCILAIAFFDLFAKTHLTIHDNSHGFVTHDKYFMDDISYHEGFSTGARSPMINDLNLKYLLKFDPEFLDFQQRPLGVPHIEKVTLHNVHDNRSIDMTSISGSTVHFHSSFFEDKKIPPLGNTTFNVVFLGREEGAIQSDLFIHTTEGRFKYQVKGASVHSPYRLRPIVGIKLPLNATFASFIYMYNPHSEPIQIVEMYSSGGDFHLELPSGEMEGPKDMWEIPPFQTKPIIRVRFHARTEQNHTAYVRIKLNNSEEVLVVPLEVEVTSAASLVASQGFVDFGMGGSADGSKQVPLLVHNPLKKTLRVHSVTSSSEAVRVEFQGAKVPGKGEQTVVIANLTLDWKKAFETKDFSGRIVIKYKNNRSATEIPFYVTVHDGGLAYDSGGIRYFVDDSFEKLKPRNVSLKNNFQTSVMLLNVSLHPNVRSHFYVANFQPFALKPGEEANVFTLKLRSGKSLVDTKINSFVTIRTNVSEISIPVLSYNGKLELVLPFASRDNSLDLGLIGSDSTKQVHFVVVNKNPVGIHLKGVKTSIPSSVVELVGCFEGDYSTALLQESYKNVSKCNVLKTDHYSVFRLAIRAFNAEGQIWGDITLETQYEQLSIPVHFKIAHGKLEVGPDRLVFDQCFPGKICTHPLRVHSTFAEPMTIEDVSSVPPDSRITCKHTGHILARTAKVVGHLYLDPSSGCLSECYCGLHRDTTAQWLKTLALNEGVSEFDLNLINMFYSRYMNYTANGTKKWQNLTMRMETSEVRGHVFKTRVKMSWPSLLTDQNMLENRSVYALPLTQVENVSLQNITIRNPSSYNLVVQVVLDRTYPELDALYEGLPPAFLPQKAVRQRKPSNRFYFAGDYAHLQKKFDDAIEQKFHSTTIPVLLAPGQNFTITVGYRVEDTTPTTGVIFLRNNLTVLELIVLKGKGAQQNFKFGNRKPGSLQPLSFELTDKHLRDCERTTTNNNGRHAPPNVTVKRSFTARNTGDMTVHVRGFRINGVPCEGYGFKVLNCEPFSLPPNTTRKIDIAFTPDFTLAKIVRTLELNTSLNVAVNYSLVTTVPAYFLPLCSNAIARPTWEGYFYFVAVFLMSSLLAFAVLTPIVDSERIVKHTLGLLVSRSCVNAQPTLDLRLLGQQTRCEIRQKLEASEKEVKTEQVKQMKEADVEKAVLVPAAPKQKKKVAKKSSNELVSDVNVKKATENVEKVQKVKPIEKIEDSLKKAVSDNGREVKKVVPMKPRANLGNICKSEDVAPCVEEETSSTTTESSSNNEELDKENCKVLKNVQQKQPVVNTYSNEEPQNGHTKLERKKSAPNKSRKDDKVENNRVLSEAKRKTRHVRDRKEKSFSNKLQKPSSNDFNNLGHTRISPSLPLVSAWTDKRATFSDVVSSYRNDCIPNYTSPTAPVTPSTRNPTPKPPQIVKPAPHSEFCERAPAELGPIGSRKHDCYQEPVHMHDEPQTHATKISNSLFMDGRRGLLGEAPNPFSDFWNGVEWESRPGKSTQSTTATWTYNTNPNGLRDSLYTPPTDARASTSQAGYLWGSSSVWQPWAPEKPKTPTRTPPGFTQHEIEMRMQQQQQRQQQNELYSPFSASNIWSQQHLTRPWDYQHRPQSEQ